MHKMQTALDVRWTHWLRTFLAAGLWIVSLLPALPASAAGAKSYSKSEIQGNYKYIFLAGEIYTESDSEIYSGIGTCTFASDSVTFFDTYQVNRTDSVYSDSSTEAYYITDDGVIYVSLTPNGSSGGDEVYYGYLSDTGIGGMLGITADGEFDLLLGFKNFSVNSAWDSRVLKGDWRGVELNLTGNPNPYFDVGFDSVTFYYNNVTTDSHYRFSFWEPGVPAMIDSYGGSYNIGATNGLIRMTTDSSTSRPTTTIVGWISDDSQVLIYADIGETNGANIGILLKRPSLDATFDTLDLFGAYSAVILARDIDTSSSTETAGDITSFYGTLIFDGFGNGQFVLPGDTESGEAEVTVQDLTYTVDDKSGTAQITVLAEDGSFGIRAAFNDSRTILVGALVDTKIGSGAPADIERMVFIAVLDPSTVEESIDEANGEVLSLSTADFTAEIDFDPGCFTEAGGKIRASILSDSSDVLSDTKNIDDSIETEQSRLFKGLDLAPSKDASKIKNDLITVTINFTAADIQKMAIDTKTFTSFEPMIMEDNNGKQEWKRVPIDSVLVGGDIEAGIFQVQFKPPHFSRYSLSARKVSKANDAGSIYRSGGVVKDLVIPLDGTNLKGILVKNMRFRSDSVTPETAVIGTKVGCTVAIGITERKDTIGLYINSNAVNDSLAIRAPTWANIMTSTETTVAKTLGFAESETGLRAYRESMYEIQFRDTKNTVITNLMDSSGGTTGTKYNFILELTLSDSHLNALVHAAGGIGSETDKLVLYSAATINGTYTDRGALTKISLATNKNVFRSSAQSKASFFTIGFSSGTAATTSTSSSSGVTAQYPSSCVLVRMFGSSSAVPALFRCVRDRIMETSLGRHAVSAYYRLIRIF